MPYKDKEKNREYQRLWRYRDHEASLIRARKFKARYRKEGRCPSCGVVLIQGEKIKCRNCTSRVFRREMIYAKSCLQLDKNL
jgi:hypothetical protein